MKKLLFILLVILLNACTQEKRDKLIAVNEPKIDQSIKLSGIYQYVYEHNTKYLIENHYLEFKNGNAFYYGTSDDFDEVREGYHPGFFKTQIDKIDIGEDTISFSLHVNDSIFYKKPISPLYKNKKNQRWDIGVRYNTRDYNGKITGDTIIIHTKNFDPRVFIKKKEENDK
ncbi:hypothetical protein [Aquimarina algicola]|uniref:Uncharacterized protein n=1 Tax=Aquimarina algicola TaxID=2589995 RepID=A0A504JDT3_9FLAO|nr:hypothetical protein [Aquimarina algicola]TPN88874.1 hypothetical protein FHK87_01275 [Aquimarina algicola]